LYLQHRELIYKTGLALSRSKRPVLSPCCKTPE